MRYYILNKHIFKYNMTEFKTYKNFITEKEFSVNKRKELADKGFALPDGSFPIENKNDIENAIQAYGRAKNQSDAAKHIAKRAKELGLKDLIPDSPVFQQSLK